METLLLSHLNLETFIRQKIKDPTSADTAETETEPRIALMNVTAIHSTSNNTWDTVLITRTFRFPASYGKRRGIAHKCLTS